MFHDQSPTVQTHVGGHTTDASVQFSADSLIQDIIYD